MIAQILTQEFEALGTDGHHGQAMNTISGKQWGKDIPTRALGWRSGRESREGC